MKDETCRFLFDSLYCLSEWDLTNIPIWTEQDIFDAKAIQRLYPNTYAIKRENKSPNRLVLLDELAVIVGFVYASDVIPNLKIDEEVKIYDIIHCKDGESQ